jgi:hypothetical protein
MDSELFDAYAQQVTFFSHGLSLRSTLFVVARRVIGKLQIQPETYLSKGRIVLTILIFLVCAITSTLFPFSRRSVIASNKTPESSPDPSTNQRIGFILSRFALQFLRFNSSFLPCNRRKWISSYHVFCSQINQSCPLQLAI